MVGFTALMRGTYSTPKTVIGNGTKREESEDPLVSFAMKVSYWTAAQQAAGLASAQVGTFCMSGDLQVLDLPRKHFSNI